MYGSNLYFFKLYCTKLNFSKLYFSKICFSNLYFSKKNPSKVYFSKLYFSKLNFSNCSFPNYIFPNCIFPNCIFPNNSSTQRTQLLRFASLFILCRSDWNRQYCVFFICYEEADNTEGTSEEMLGSAETQNFTKCCSQNLDCNQFREATHTK